MKSLSGIDGVSRKRKYPRILLAMTHEDERRKALLTFTKEHFIVDECPLSSNLVGMWRYPTFYDAVIVMHDKDADPGCHLSVAEIRHSEAANELQIASSSAVVRKVRSQEAESWLLAAHRAQRFAEQRLRRQQVIDANNLLQRRGIPTAASTVNQVENSSHSGGVPADGLYRTLIVGFYGSNPEWKSTMLISGHYDYVLAGTPSVSEHVEFLCGVLRAEYHLPRSDTIPSFDEVVRHLKHLEAATRGGGGGGGGVEQDGGVVSSSRALQAAPASPRIGTTTTTTMASTEEDSGTRRYAPPSSSGSPAASRLASHVSRMGMGNGSPANDIASVGILHLQRQVREANAKIEDLTAAQRATEHDLEMAHKSSQELRTMLEACQERCVAAEDARIAAEDKLRSRTAECSELKKEMEIQMRHMKAANPTAVLNADVQHLVHQNHRLRDAALQFETSLHEVTAECKALRRRLDRLVNGLQPGSGDAKPQQERRKTAAPISSQQQQVDDSETQQQPKRHASLMRMALPGADEIFADPDAIEREYDEDGGEHFGDEVILSGSDSDSNDENGGDSSKTKKGGVGARSFLQRSFRGMKAPQRLSRTQSTLMKRALRGEEQLTHTWAACEGLECSLMEFHDAASHQRELFASSKSLIDDKKAIRTRISVQSFFNPAAVAGSSSSSSSSSVAANEDASVRVGTPSFAYEALLEAWGKVESEYRACEAADKQRQQLHASSPKPLDYAIRAYPHLFNVGVANRRRSVPRGDPFAISGVFTTSISGAEDPSDSHSSAGAAATTPQVNDEEAKALRMVLKADGVSGIGSAEIADAINNSLSCAATVLIETFHAYRRILSDLMSEALLRYDQVAKSIPALFGKHAPYAMAALNLISLHTFQSFKKSAVSLSRCKEAEDDRLARAMVHGTVAIALVVNPLKALCVDAAHQGILKRRCDFATQTEVGGALSQHHSHHRTPAGSTHLHARSPSSIDAGGSINPGGSTPISPRPPLSLPVSPSHQAQLSRRRSTVILHNDA